MSHVFCKAEEEIVETSNNLLSDKSGAISNIAGYSDKILSNKSGAISNIAGYSDKILCACAPHDNQRMAIERTQQGHGAPVWSLKMSMSNARMDRGPIGTAHSLSEEAERWR
jgi:hypothetical protein